ncbi:MAG: hypothetical protein ABIP61_03130 [Burkholderiaceae bacterium]
MAPNPRRALARTTVIDACLATLLAVNPKPPPVTPNALPIDEALRRSAPLVRLRQLMQESNARFEAIRPSLPAALAAHVRPGPVDALGWSLLAANGAVAAKLRQLQPRLEETLRDAGWQISAIRVRVQSG